MKNIKRHSKIIITAVLPLIVLAFTLSCERDISMLEPAGNPTTPEVFLDDFAGGLDYSAYANSKLDAFEIDDQVKYAGTRSMKITVPYPDDPSGWFAGGAFFSYPRDLSGYTALTFWAKASKTTTVDAGFGNDNNGNSEFMVMQSGIVLGSTWQKVIIPIPDPSKLTAERGMFQYAAGADGNGLGSTIWFDEVQYEKVGTIAHPRILLSDTLISTWVGRDFEAGIDGVIYNVGGLDQTLGVSENYFTLASTNDTVAVISADGKISAVGEGRAKILVSLGNTVTDSITVVVGDGNGPAAAAPVPTVPADSVLSLYSNAYTNHQGTVWNTYWEFSTAQTEDLQIDGDDVLLYTNLNFVGIEFLSPMVNAADMTHFHLDIWTPEDVSGASFKIKLVDFGSDGVYGGGDDSDHELTLTASTDPAIASGEWVSMDIPLADFAGLTSRSHLAQLVLSGDLSTVFVDNVFFYMSSSGGGSGSSGPQTAAPAPTYAAADVISVFSDAYTDLTGSNFFADWGQQTSASQVFIAGSSTLLYSGFNYQGIELAGSTDISTMEYLHLDVWTENSTSFNVYLISTGPVEQAYALTVPTSGWSSVDIPLSSFSSVDLADVIQLKFDGNGDIYLDNILWYKESSSSGGTEPAGSAPTPTYAAADVVSIFSDSYTNVTVDTWSADWDQANVADFQIGTDNLKHYTNVVFTGTEFTSSTIDAGSMTHFRVDMWTPEDVSAASLKIKLVDFGPDGAWSGGDDTEHELTFTATSTPALKKGQWITFDIPLSSFTGLTTKNHLSQLIFSGDVSEFFIDNVLLHK